MYRLKINKLILDTLSITFPINVIAINENFKGRV